MKNAAHKIESETPARTAIGDDALLAALDLGSNSFHMVVARHVLGQLRVVDRLRETVRLAEGLDDDGGLREDVLDRALECLSRFGQRIRNIPSHCVRVVATNTVRQLRDPRVFLQPAEAALGHPIEIISGREEARLVYLGVAHASPPTGKRRLVIDIGGGSTECIIGSGLDALERESLQVGCVASTRRFFADGKLSKKRWKEALTEVTAEFQQFAGVYRQLGWDEALGSSGTNRAIGDICAAMKLTKGAVTADALPQVRDRLLAAGRIDNIDLPSLSAERRPIIAGGILVLEAAFDALGLQRMAVSKAALREGVLYDMLGRGSGADPRDTSVHALTRNHGDCSRTIACCWPGLHACTNSASPSPIASTTCTVPTCWNIPTSRASRSRNNASCRPWCARIVAASRSPPSTRCPNACSRPHAAAPRCCAWRYCCSARTKPTPCPTWDWLPTAIR
jgi:exopolyphosphatase/guanosine-5'-triphosphate,3'-diphosphate pyrophosphatase